MTRRGHAAWPHYRDGSTGALSPRGPGQVPTARAGAQVFSFVGPGPPLPHSQGCVRPLSVQHTLSWVELEDRKENFIVSVQRFHAIPSSPQARAVGHPGAGGAGARSGPAAASSPRSSPSPPELRQQRLAQHLLLLGCEAGGELDVEEDEEVPLPGGLLWQRHPFPRHLLEVLGAETGGMRGGAQRTPQGCPGTDPIHPCPRNLRPGGQAPASRTRGRGGVTGLFQTTCSLKTHLH